MTAPHHPYRRLSDHLILAADALLLTVLAGAVLIILKNLANIPADWIDPTDAFLVTMTVASVLGATASWVLHRRPVGLRGLGMLAVGLLVAAPALVAAHAVIIRTSVSSPGTELVLLIVAQILGLAVLLPPLVAGMADFFQPKERRFDPGSIARLAGLIALVGLIALRSCPRRRWTPPRLTSTPCWVCRRSPAAWAWGSPTRSSTSAKAGHDGVPAQRPLHPRPPERRP